MSELVDVLTPNGDYTDKVASRDECHAKGYFHRGVVVFVVSPEHDRVLLQQRSEKKKLWPGLWDVTAGGHVSAGEFGFEAAIREAQEEIGIELQPHDLVCIGVNTSENLFPGVTDRHFNEYFVMEREIDPEKLILQEDEVQALRWFTKQELESHVRDNYCGLVTKTGCWDRIMRFLAK